MEYDYPRDYVDKVDDEVIKMEHKLFISHDLFIF